MDFTQFATSEFGTRLWIDLGKWLSPGTGRALARSIADTLARRRHSDLYRAVYSNQSVVRRGAASERDLDRAVWGVLRHASRVSWDLVRLLSLGDEAVRTAMNFPSSVFAHVEEARASGHGIMFCGVHMSAFNLGFVSFALRGLPLQILLPQAGGGYQLMQRMLTRQQIEATQLSTATLRAALQRLRSGGMVITGIEWPEAGGETEMLPFFGRPARLPTGHIRMAMSTDACLIPVTCRWDPGTGYRLLTAPPMELELTGDRLADVRHNARRVLAVAERWIAERSEQWFMYYPVWAPRSEFRGFGGTATEIAA
jgi:KDO2-lipid IV(A) lauroyltransferase